MGSEIIVPTSIVVQGTVPTIVGGASDEVEALNTESDGKYIQLTSSGGGGGGDYVTTFHFSNPTIPAGAIVEGLRFLLQISTNGATSHFYPSFLLVQTPDGVNTAMLWLSDTVTGIPTTLVMTDWQSQLYSKPNIGVVEGQHFDDFDLDTIQATLNKKYVSGRTIRAEYYAIEILYNEKPTVANFEPSDLSGGETATTRPTMVWEYADAENDPQQAYQIRVYDDDDPDGTGFRPSNVSFDPDNTSWPVILDTGKVFSGAQRAQLPTPLDNGRTYVAFLRAYQGNVINREHYSDWEKVEFTVDTTPPATPSLEVDVDNSEAVARLKVTAGGWDPITASYLVQRSTDGGETWTDVSVAPDLSDGRAVRFNGQITDQVFGALIQELQIPDDSSFTIIIDCALDDWGTSQGLAAHHGVKFALVNGALDVDLQSGNHLTTSDLFSSLPNGTRMQIRFEVQPDNGNGEHQLDVWTRVSEFDSWTHLETVVEPGTVSSNTQEIIALVTMGDTSQTGENPATGVFWDYRAYAGLISDGSDSLVVSFDGVPVAIKDNQFTSSSATNWQIQNSTAGAPTWVSIADDYEIEHDQWTIYRVKAVGEDIAGTVTSDWVESDPVLMTVDESKGFWFKDLNNPQNNIQLHLDLPSRNGSRDKDAAVFNPMGRNEFLIVSDAVRPYKRSFVADCRSYAEFNALERLLEEAETILVQGSTFQSYVQVLDWSESWINHAVGAVMVNITTAEETR